MIYCPFKGCRARSFAAKVDETVSLIIADRDRLSPGKFGTVPTALVYSGLSQLSSMFKLKLHWVHELPYSIWTVRVGGRGLG